MTIATARLALCIAAVLSAAGCASTGLFDSSPNGPGAAHTSAGQAPTLQAASDLITIGKSTKAEVANALGQAIVIPFDGGSEVWVYRWPGAGRSMRAASELVLLFEPSGVVTKLRVRPGYSARD